LLLLEAKRAEAGEEAPAEVAGARQINGNPHGLELGMFEFHAGHLYIDDASPRIIQFAERKTDTRCHYLLMVRSEESPEEAVPDMQNVYVRRDDQCWGGHGGIELVLLNRDSLTLKLGPRMTKQVGGHDTIYVTFRIKDVEFRELRQALGFILSGYEAQLQVHADRMESNVQIMENTAFETPAANAGP
jgi:hypothetical protein